MKYVYVHWRLSGEHRPAEMFYEIDDDLVEVRKVEKYPGGHMDVAGPEIETGETWISGDRFPSLEEINSDGEFVAKEISGHEFNEIWGQAIIHLRMVGKIS
ncbi:hypothetical protein MAUB1S_05269 [Mycolicibacterium aubagnense]